MSETIISLNTLGEKIGGLISSVQDELEDISTDDISTITNALENGMEIGQDAMDKLKVFFQFVVDNHEEMVETLISTLTAGAKAFPEVFNSLVQCGIELGSEALAVLGEIELKELTDEGKALLLSINKIPGAREAITESRAEIVEALSEGKELGAESLEAMNTAVSQFDPNEYKDEAEEIASVLQNGMKDGAEGLKSVFQTLGQTVYDLNPEFFEELGSTLIEVGADVVDVAQDIGEVAVSVGNDIGQEIGEVIPTETINRAFADVDEFLKDGLPQLPDMEFEDVEEMYSQGSQALKATFALAMGLSTQVFDFVKFDIFRDFWQVISLFFSGFQMPQVFKSSFGWLSQTISLDISFYIPTLQPTTFMWIVLVISLISYIWAMAKKSDDPDALVDGKEIVRWEDRSAWEKHSTKVLFTILTTLYLPASRNAVQLLLCHPTYLNDPNYTCTNGSPDTLYIIVAIISLLVITLATPISLYKLVQKNKPEVRNFDAATGEEKEYTNADYRQDLDGDKSPYKFLYDGYERDWAFYKIIVMIFKLVLVLCVVALFSLPVVSLIATTVVLLIFAGISTYSQPFIKDEDDYMDMVGRIVALLTMLTTLINAFVQGAEAEGVFGVLMIVFNIMSIVGMIFFTLIGSKKFKAKFKNFRGKFDLTNTELNYDLHRELKTRVWQPFWEGLFSADETLKESAFTRLVECKNVMSYVGAEVYRREVEEPLSEESATNREYIINELEGLDAYWDQAGDVTWGKMWIDDWPFTCVFVSDSGDAVKIDRDTQDQFASINQSNSVLERRETRHKLRALKGHTVHCEYSEHRNLGKVNDGHDDEGKPINEREETVTLYFHRGVFQTSNSGSTEWAHGFSQSIHYSDGEGTTSEGRHLTNQSGTAGSGHFGVIASYEMTETLAEFLNDPENAPVWQEHLPGILEHFANYRQEMKDGRAAKVAQLSWEFLHTVFNNHTLSQEQLHELLQQEENEAVQQLMGNHASGIKFLYTRISLFRSHPAVGFWFTVFDDIWDLNNEMACFEGHEELFDPKKSSSLAYKPMSRSDLESKLEECELLHPKKFFNEPLINTLYEKMNEYARKTPGNGTDENV